MKPVVHYRSVSGITYQEGWDLQTVMHTELKTNKLEWRNLAEEERSKKRQCHYLLFCEHNHVYTLGKSGSADHLLLDSSGLERHNVEYFKINRGGDITYHGPGQITGYPILDLDEFFTDVHKYVRLLEQCVIELLAAYDIRGSRVEGFTGVWIIPNDKALPMRKICAIGVHLSRWVTMHGFALNVNTDLTYFDHIIPCGIDDSDKVVTSMARELGRNLDLEEVKLVLKGIFARIFDFEYTK